MLDNSIDRMREQIQQGLQNGKLTIDERSAAKSALVSTNEYKQSREIVNAGPAALEFVNKDKVVYNKDGTVDVIT